MGKRLSFEDIMAVEDLTTQVVDVPEWGGEVEVVVFTKATQQRLVRESTVGNAAGGTQLDTDLLEKKMVQFGLADPALSEAQVDALWLKNAKSVQAILQAILEVNHMLPGGQPDLARAEADFRPGA